MSDNTYCEQLARRIMKTPRVKKALKNQDTSDIWHAARIEFQKIKDGWVHPLNQSMKILISYVPVDDDRNIYRPPSFFAGWPEGNDGLADSVKATAWHCLGWTILDLSGLDSSGLR